jgi:subtilisin
LSGAPGDEQSPRRAAAPLGTRPYPRPRWLWDAVGTADGTGVHVAVVDSGWDPTVAVPGLRLAEGVSFVGTGKGDGGQEAWRDENGHGTACTTLAFRVAPGAAYHPVRIFGRTLRAPAAALCAGLEWAAGCGVDVAALSLGAFHLEPTPRDRLYAACERARRAGVLIVAANDAELGDGYPAVFENVLSVGTGMYRKPWDFGYQVGQATECEAAEFRGTVQVGARTLDLRGASLAVPAIVGLLALLRERYPGLSLESARRWLGEHSAHVRSPFTPAQPEA